MADTETKDSSSLEGKTTVVDTSSPASSDSLEGSSSSTSTDSSAASPAPAPKKKKNFLHGRFNIYLLLFILVLVIAGAAVLITAFTAEKESKQQEAAIASQSLPKDTLDQLANSDATVGDPKQVLNVQSNAVFAGNVLVRDSLEVAGTIKVGGALSLPGITVSGQSNFDSVQVNQALNIGGDASIQGQLNVRRNLSVSGNGTFGGPLTAPQITTSTFQLLGDLSLSRHITTTGATPGRSNGGALGGGGTASVGGTDTAGSVNINTGGGTAAGCLVSINFTQRYGSTPHVIITPVGSAASLVNYYINRSATGFSICSSNSPPASSSFGFDYIVIE